MSTVVANRYARALADVLARKGDYRAALKELQGFAAAYGASRELREVLKTPAVPLEQKTKVLEAVLARLKASTVTRNFLRVLLANYRMVLLEKVVEGFRRVANARMGIAEVRVSSGARLSPAEEEALRAAFRKLTREQIENFDHSVRISEVGSVISVGDGVARIYGLDNAMAGELLELPHNVAGLALNLEEDQVSAVLLGDYSRIKEGDVVKRTKQIMSVPVGEALVGRVVDSLGRPADGKGPVLTEHYNTIERLAPGGVDRLPVREPLQTGIKAIDAMIPIGRGQRELIIGDRQTGKTALVLDTIINQRGGDVICIYVAIGQKRSTVAQVVKVLEEHEAMEYTIVVEASSSDPAPMQYLAPYAGCAMGEYFRDRGRHALCVYDDLSRSEEHTSELQSLAYLVCRLLLEKKK